ncbi:hypothetical protein LR69_00527 [Geobacillus sp. BCO2]|nr:hypothetical protein LR69_00527 [Geobacillus sp. BCO2]
MYDKRLYVFDGNTPREAVIRNYTTDDFADLIRVQQESFPPPFPSELWWNEQQLHNHVTLFPEGALCVEVDGRIVGSMTGLIVDFDPAMPIIHGKRSPTAATSATTARMETRCMSSTFASRRHTGSSASANGSCSRCMKSSSISALTGCSAAGGCLATIDMRLNYRRKLHRQSRCWRAERSGHYVFAPLRANAACDCPELFRRRRIAQPCRVNGMAQSV